MDFYFLSVLITYLWRIGFVSLGFRMRGLKISLILSGLSMLAACAQPSTVDEINDPHEAQNRKVHEFNKTVDRKVFKLVAQGTVNTLECCDNAKISKPTDVRRIDMLSMFNTPP